MTWTVIADENLNVDAAARSVDIKGMRDNFQGMASRDSGAPKVNPSDIVALTGSGNYEVPAGVTSLRVQCYGGAGGGADGTDGAASGSSTTFSSGGTLITAGGGGGGQPRVPSTGGAGGTASGGDINLAGEAGGTGVLEHGGAGGATAGPYRAFRRGGEGETESTTGLRGGGGGGGGGFAQKAFTTSPEAIIPYSVGAGGAGGSPNGTVGDAGTIIIEF